MSTENQTSPPVALGQRLALGFTKIGLALRHRAWQEAHASELTPTQGQSLVILLNHPGATLAEVARQLGVRASTASEAVSALSQKELVSKERDPDDGRVVRLHLTREGRRHAAEAGLWPDFLARAIEDLPRDEARVLVRTLQRIIRSLQAQGEIPVARMCSTCTYFRPFRHDDSHQPHHCAFIDAAFGELELRFECGDFVPADEPRAAERFFRTADSGGVTPLI